MSGSTLFILVLGGFGTWLAVDYVRNYLSTCRKCKGTGVLRATFWSRQYRPCPRCNRSGEVSHQWGPK